jgi:hypothetical protein
MLERGMVDLCARLLSLCVRLRDEAMLWQKKENVVREIQRSYVLM